MVDVVANGKFHRGKYTTVFLLTLSECFKALQFSWYCAVYCFLSEAVESYKAETFPLKLNKTFITLTFFNDETSGESSSSKLFAKSSWDIFEVFENRFPKFTLQSAKHQSWEVPSSQLTLAVIMIKDEHSDNFIYLARVWGRIFEILYWKEKQGKINICKLFQNKYLLCFNFYLRSSHFSDNIVSSLLTFLVSVTKQQRRFKDKIK